MVSQSLRIGDNQIRMRQDMPFQSRVHPGSNSPAAHSVAGERITEIRYPRDSESLLQAQRR